ncbi:MAG: ATP-binding cassette domain-containing protein [Duodenibacillus sp.]|nr:ATP-binding cassette domain-containing protein [Duodenibacillus sp.]
MSTLLQIENAVFEANGRPVIDGVSFTVPEGRCLCIVGPSGSGKSSLLRLFNRLNVKTSGEILFKGEPIESVPVPTLRRRIGMVFQKTTVFSGTVADNLRMVLDLAGKKPG